MGKTLSISVHLSAFRRLTHLACVGVLAVAMGACDNVAVSGEAVDSVADAVLDDLGVQLDQGVPSGDSGATDAAANPDIPVGPDDSEVADVTEATNNTDGLDALDATEGADVVDVADVADAADVPIVSAPAMPCDAKTPCVTGVCEPATRACVGCLTTQDCGTAAVCRDHVCLPVPPCASDKECKAAGLVCGDQGGCVDCNVTDDCPTAHACQDHACVPATPCKTSKDCTGVCDKTSGTCVDCNITADCPTGQFCDASHDCRPALCSGGACAASGWFGCKADGGGYEAAATCDDGTPCTADTCQPGQGCAHAAVGGNCDDGDACTLTSSCADGACIGQPIDCDDQNECTTDSCDPVAGCVKTPNALACDDFNPCTTQDACSGGICKAGAPVSCDDGNP
jgi:hypothetical protein